MKRIQEEILKRIEDRRPNDILGFEWNEYIQFLNYKNAKKFLKDEVTEKEWDYIRTDPIKQIKDYMDFAFEKARNERGISANRSVMHMIAWLWLAGEDKLCSWVDNEFESNYHSYGKPILLKICEHFNWDRT